MENETTYTTTYCYPGDYVPMLKKEEFEKEMAHFYEDKIVFPPANISELPDAYQVDVAMPGIRREEFVVNIESNVLFIRVLHKEAKLTVAPKLQVCGFNNVCFEKRVNLPANADPSFMNAEFKAGILRVIIPKATCPIDGSSTQVVVY
jgi:HSP20 family protein